MLEMEVVAYDFDGSIQAQLAMLNAQGVQPVLHAMRQHETATRLWASAKAFAAMASQLRPRTSLPQFSLIGSGDYHHISLALIARFETPLTVVLFDNHPDWMQPPHQYHCGTWVYQLARLPQVKRVIIVGLESGDIDYDQFKKGDVESFLQQKIILLPYRKVQVNAQQPLFLHSKLAQDLTTGIQEVLSYIDTEQVYISIDKDCLQAADAKTNWEQGSLPLATVTAVIQALSQHKQLIGADTVGDFSPVRFRSPLKWIASYLDRKVHPREAVQVAAQVNAAANLRLLHALKGGA
ncbi:hypothetical protein GOC95_08710 [Methylophilus sp. YYY-1]|nr:hypothetical protein [Methylophilus sp. YYY-1]